MDQKADQIGVSHLRFIKSWNDDGSLPHLRSFASQGVRTDTEAVISQNLDDTTLSGLARIVGISYPHQLCPKLGENK